MNSVLYTELTPSGSKQNMVKNWLRCGLSQTKSYFRIHIEYKHETESSYASLNSAM